MSNINTQENAREKYLAGFEDFVKSLNGSGDTVLSQYREKGLGKLKELNFPTQRDEEWRYTNVNAILKEDFVPAAKAEKANITKADIEALVFGGFESYLAVFVNGIYEPELSNVEGVGGGIVVDSLANVAKNNPGILEGKLASEDAYGNAFNALNLAYSHDGIVVYLPKGKVLDKPLQVLFLNGHKNEIVISQPRNILIAEENSEAKIIYNFRGLNGKKYFTNTVTEAFTAKSARIGVYKIQDENRDSYHVDKTQAYQEKESVFSHYNLSFGGSIVRNDINAQMNGENIETNYYGLYLANGDQHIDNHTFADHASPNCVSNELYKGILEDKARGVFNGKILVRQDAQKTNAYQSNKTILLSDDARIDTKPQLEIYADDVKCSHGATIGHLDDIAYFYIRSRGVPAELAKSMLIRAFANDVVETVNIEPLKEQINHMIFEHLNRVEI